MQRLETEIMHKAELKAEDARIEFMKKQGKRFQARHKTILKRRAYVFSESTDIGLKVTLLNTLGLLEFLTSKNIGYYFLMTARLNQDALEVCKFLT